MGDLGKPTTSCGGCDLLNRLAQFGASSQLTQNTHQIAGHFDS